MDTLRTALWLLLSAVITGTIWAVIVLAGLLIGWTIG